MSQPRDLAAVLAECKTWIAALAHVAGADDNADITELQTQLTMHLARIAVHRNNLLATETPYNRMPV